MDCQNYLYKIRTCKHDAFVWVIDKSYRNFEVGEMIQSPTFTVEEDYEWVLQFYPKSDSHDYQDYFSIYLKSVSEEDVSVRFVCSVLSDKSQILFKTNMQTATFSPDMSMGAKKFAKSNDVHNEVFGKVAVQGDLRLLCEIWMDDGHTGNATGPADFDFEKLVNNETFSDVKFSVEGQIMYAHRTILANRSAVFGIMFDSCAHSPEHPDVITIDDIEYDVMAELFRFIYCGKVIDVTNKAKKLLTAAFKYGVIEIIPVCEKSLVETLSINNVFDVLQLTADVGSQKLRQKVLLFIANHLKDVSKTPRFEHLRFVQIDDAFEIISHLAKKIEN